MTRILERSDTGPLQIKKDEIEGDAIYVCRCGLSAKQPFCDGSHGKTRQEVDGVLYAYERDAEGKLTRHAVVVKAKEEGMEE